MNKFILIGNLTRDPEFRTTPSGIKMIQFIVADNQKNAEKQDVVTFYRCTKWGEDRFITDWVKKSSHVMVTGTLQPPKIFNGKDGLPKLGLDVTVHSVEFIPGKRKEGEATPAPTFRAAKDGDMFDAPSVPKPWGMNSRPYGQDDEDDEAPF